MLITCAAVVGVTGEAADVVTDEALVEPAAVVVCDVEPVVGLAVPTSPTQTPLSQVPPSWQVHSELIVASLTVQLEPVQPGRQTRLPLRLHV